MKQALPKILAGLTTELKVDLLFDQSLFVQRGDPRRGARSAIAAFLTGLMILLFLGSWRSTLIVCISIPLSILTSIIILNLMGQTINVMTLGGLALAVGILVDDATVEIENTHRNMGDEQAAGAGSAGWSACRSRFRRLFRRLRSASSLFRCCC